MSTIGTNILKRRKELNMTQEELAKKIGYTSKSTINKIENGINDIPQSKIVAFAEALKTTPAYLMGWEQEQQKNDAIADIVGELRTNQEFLDTVTILKSLEKEKFDSIKQMLSLLK